ncbi:hypothetical protein CR203_19960 [Salipaludibacillus neizhouensis]|uniref:DUF2225 domain-containing protein n=1 Tax=Salipaludibacillus neizhouensis TaxID=885475 RepID=A0A3A9K2X7_9BACI|nr:DUF2225 domain-containing protein [Salipaludibacillus neizhouensis]RKL65598.1 hypothetical protein CR203_19960 [Salipaludibacillus neizhouensis]
MDLEPLYDKEVTCPNCNLAFYSKKIRSRFIRVNEVFNDYSKDYKDEQLNPVLYEISVCSACGYGFNEQFDPILKPSIKEQFNQKVSKYWTSQDFSGTRSYENSVKTYKLAILSAEITNQPYIVRGSLCMKLSWLFRTMNEKQEEIRFIEMALEQFEDSYKHGDFIQKSVSELMLLFLLGEYYRKVGKKEQSINYFSKVIQHKDKQKEAAIVEKAREQWQEARAM